MSDNGRDMTVFPDLSLSRIVSGRQNRAEALARRLMTPPGGLFYDPGYGLDVREWLNDGADDYVWLERARLVAYQCERDPYIASAEATVIPPTPRNDIFVITIYLEDVQGAVFSLELSVSKFLVEVRNVISNPVSG